MQLFSFLKGKKSVNNELLILYGTKSGNSKLIAQRAQKLYTKNGLNTVCENVSKIVPEQLKNYSKLLLIVSTHGEGEPPPSAKKFFKLCQSNSMINLSHLSYSICALGDSSYKEFCKAGKVLDHRFAELGANCFYKRTDCDENFSDDAVKWIKECAKVLLGDNKKSENCNLISDTKEYKAKIIDRKLLSSDQCDSPTYHLSLDIKNLGLAYSIGDSIEIFPQNPQNLLLLLSKKLNLKSYKKLENKEITRISLKTLIKYNDIIESKKLNKLLKTEKDLEKYLAKANLLDLISDYSTKLDAKTLLKLIPSIKGRKYSIASSQKLHADLLDLTIKTIRYKFNKSIHEGAASVFTNETLNLNSTLKFRIYKNNEFIMPSSTNIPIIMIGVSTGIAYFRAMLQEREALNAKGNTWLIWGNKNADKDFLYKDDLLAFKERKVLEKLDTVFSCGGNKKLHVHNILEAQAKLFETWITNGAHIYICGSIKMSKSITKTIEKLLKDTKINIEQLISASRWHEDVY
jgi:sulfite reductase alpha subunit-like flavoprotein